MKVFKELKCYNCSQIKDCWGEHPTDFTRHCQDCIAQFFQKAQKSE